jgi:hypothetical protein
LFSEEKKQKTFISPQLPIGRPRPGYIRERSNKSLLVLFFRKELLSSLLIRTGNHAAHLLMEAAIGLCAVLAIFGCIGAWRLAQGPIDITSLVQREQPLLAPKGTQISVGYAALAWEGFVASNQPLDIRVRNLRLDATDGSLLVQLPHARLTLSIGQMLIGRIVPRTVWVKGAVVQMQRRADGSVPAPFGAKSGSKPGNTRDRQAILEELAKPARLGEHLPWLSQLRRVDLRDARVTMRDEKLGVFWQAPHIDLQFARLGGGGVSGQAHIDLAAGDIHATLTARAELGAGGTHITAGMTPLSPAALAKLSPAFAPLAAVDLPLQAGLDATLGPALELLSARLEVIGSPGTIAGGGASTALRSADIVVLAKPSELILQTARIAFVAAPGKLSPPVITAEATAKMLVGRVHATFGLGIQAMEMGDLADYWPPGLARGSRGWLVQNITGGHAHDARVEGAVDAGIDGSDVKLTALSGGLSADDVTLSWLRPIPPLTHGRARLIIDGPDSLHIAMDTAEQDKLRVLPGSSMVISKLQEKHQFGDIEVRLAGPLDTALALLNHPRLKLLTRSGLNFTGASGEAQARLMVHMPLEDTVTMDDIRISAESTIARVHLGKIAAGRDLDDADLSLKVNNDGLALTGHGAYAGIPTDLTLDMDFRPGPAEQVMQHVTAHGTASAAEIAGAGLPDDIAENFPAGSADIGVDYAAIRNHTAILKLSAELKNAELKTPFGWKKAVGPDASAGARLLWDHGSLTSIDHLRAEGPGLLIASHATLEADRARALVLDRLEFGQTRAHGEIGFPVKPTDPLTVTLSGSMLDLSSYLDEPAAQRADTMPDKPERLPETQGKREEPWSANLDFSSVTLAKGKILTPFKLVAASDGLHITHAELNAGAPGELAARIVAGASTRAVHVTSSDAGTFLRAMGVADNLAGGHLQLDAVFNDTLPSDPLTGTATLDNFNVKQAPAVGRLLQAMTLYGLTDVLRGPGMHFSKLVAPFRWQRRVLTLKSARAFSPSLGLTAEGDVDLLHRVANVKGTIVPAYFFNQLLGDLPLVGRIFSPEKGGGLFAARYSVTGKLSDPKVGVNPLSALTPGFLREGFGLLSPKQAVP